jgi:gp45 sliding clamp, C terminal
LKTTMQESETLIMTTTKTMTNAITISKRTLEILKNFASINSGIIVNEGNTLNTLSSTKNILAEAKVNETFTKSFAIWDLNKFLGTVSLFKDPEFVFEDNYITVRSGKSSVRYYYCDPRLVTSTNKKISMPKPVVQFDLTAKDFAEVIKAASVLQVGQLCVRSSHDCSKIELAAVDKSDATSNFYSLVVGDNESGATFEFIFDVENLKIMPGDYTVAISEKVVSSFSSKNDPITYWIALNADSTYEA